MLTLAFDTSTSHGSVALFEDGALLSQREWHLAANHSEVLTENISVCCRDAGRTLAQVDQIAVDHGPGSFTGLRVAVSSARALAYALKKPVIALNACEILAQAVFEKTPSEKRVPLLILLNAHRNLFFAAFFSPTTVDFKATSQIETLTVDELDQRVTSTVLCVGDGFAELTPFPDLQKKLRRQSDFDDFPRAETLGRMAWQLQKSTTPLDWKTLQPLYIRASGAEEKVREGQAKT